MEVYLTKYALTSGIEIVDAEQVPSGLWSIVGRHCYYSKDDCYEQESDAIEKAELMRQKKLKSLYKQVAKISAMRFKSLPK